MTARQNDVPPAGADWRRRLLEALEDSEATRARIDRELTRDVVILLAVSILVFLPLLSFALALAESSTAWSALIPLLLCLPFSIFLVVRFMQFMLRMRSGSARAALLTDPRRPVLYLRSFGFDERLNSSSVESPEQVLAGRFGQLGPVVAVGRPNERLPPIGAARFYTTDDNWHQKVTELVSAAKYIVWVTGATKGLAWELSFILRSFPTQKLIVVAHPQLLPLPESQRQEEWARFLEVLGALFPKPMPRTLGNVHLLHFDHDGQPRPISPERAAVFGGLRRKHNLDRAIDLLFAGMGLVDAAVLRRRSRVRTLSRWLLGLSAAALLFAALTGNEALGIMAGWSLLASIIWSFVLMVRPTPVRADARQP